MRCLKVDLRVGEIHIVSLYQAGTSVKSTHCFVCRHISSTKMNAESSRSHLIIGVVIESRNLMTDAVTTGKLSIVDLAGFGSLLGVVRIIPTHSSQFQIRALVQDWRHGTAGCS